MAIIRIKESEAIDILSREYTGKTKLDAIRSMFYRGILDLFIEKVISHMERHNMLAHG